MSEATQPRYGMDPYLDWVKTEGLPVAEDYALDLFAVPTADWPRFGVKGGAAHLKGRGDFCNMFRPRASSGEVDHSAAPSL
jgi:hypothetical protein